jgi:hypothetical protein
MTRFSRLALALALLGLAACSGAPAAPRAPSTMTPHVEAQLDETDDCRGGWSVQNGKAC